MEVKEAITKFLQNIRLLLNNLTKSATTSLKDILSNQPGYCIGLIMIFFFIKYDLLTVSISGCIIYLTIIIRQYIRNKIEQDILNNIDLDRWGDKIDGSNKKTIMDIIGEYVEECFDRDVLFFNVIQYDDYIDNETERRLLNELLDSALVNMSDQMRMKLSQYVGSDNLTHIIARRCMMTITIYVANHNKNIYQRISDDNKKIEI